MCTTRILVTWEDKVPQENNIFCYRAQLLGIYFKQKKKGVGCILVSHSSHAINIYYYDPDLNYSTFLYRFHCIITLTLNYTEVHIITFNSKYIGFLSRFCADPQSKPWQDHFSVIRSQIFPDLKKNKKKNRTNGVLFKN